jgi:hypothetical protein
MLASWTGASTLTATGTPTAASYNATSTTATSTFAGGFRAAGTTGLNVLQNGNIGVGLANPAAKLHVQATAGASLRENLYKSAVSDAGNDAFYLTNNSHIDTTCRFQSSLESDV